MNYVSATAQFTCALTATADYGTYPRQWLCARPRGKDIMPSEPKRYRVQKYPLPDIQPVLAIAKQRRLSWLEAMRAVSQSRLTEQQRESRLDNIPDEEYLD